MNDNYLTINIPENLAREWFRGVGAEIVVRCRDCKHYHTEEDRVKTKTCDLFNFDADEDDFCSRGWKKLKPIDAKDTMEAVRCLDCKYWRPENNSEYGTCQRYEHIARADCHCSDGERREK